MARFFSQATNNYLPLRPDVEVWPRVEEERLAVDVFFIVFFVPSFICMPLASFMSQSLFMFFVSFLLSCISLSIFYFSEPYKPKKKSFPSLILILCKKMRLIINGYNPRFMGFLKKNCLTLTVFLKQMIIMILPLGFDPYLEI